MKPVEGRKLTQGQRFAGNLIRLAGLHGLNDIGLGKVLGVSPAAISTWRHGRREPGGSTVIAISEVFEIPPHLLTGDFEQILPLVSDPERFSRTEKRVKAAQTQLQAVG